MKRWIIYIIFSSLIIFTNQCFAQDSTRAKTAEDIINIKELVDQQIREIQEAEAKKNNEAGSVLISDNPKTENAEIIPAIKEEAPLIKDIYIKIIIGIETILLLFIIYFWYKKKSKEQKSEFSDLKKNIRRLREEKIGGLLDNTLTKVRSGLILQVANIDSRNITAHAKKLSISKGELHLAAKINLMMQKS